MDNPLTKTLRKDKPPILKRVGKAAVALVAATATLLSGMVTASSTLAITSQGHPGYNTSAFTYGTFHTGDNYMDIGVVGYSNGKPAYCINLGEIYTGSGTWATQPATGDWKIAAVMVDRNQNNNDDMTQAGVAYAIHDHLDVSNSGGGNNPGIWNAFKNQAEIHAPGGKAAVAAKAAELWNDAVAHTTSSINATYSYTKGKRTGTANPGVKNSSGQYISGVRYTLTLSGPAKFDATGTSTYSGVTTGGEEHIPWTATGNGTVTYTNKVSVPRVAKLNSPGQDVIQASDPENQSANISFQVQKDFQPTVTTKVNSKQLTRGSPVQDNVTSGVASSDDEWADGVPVKFKGYYFVGDSKHILQTIKKNNGENPTDYLKRLRETDGIRQVAAATTSFTKSGQTNTVKAKAATGGIDYDSVNGLDDYQVSDEDAGLFGTWVWVEVKADQSQQDYIKGDYIDEFGKTQETSVSVLPPNHDSTVLEQESGMNKDILDEINISRLPSDYGKFTGDTNYGFNADAKAKIRVWWAGSGTGNKDEDEKYVPTTEEEPTQDANHKLVGEWEVPAMNGKYKVGGGKIVLYPSDGSDAKTVATDVNIKVTDKAHCGYYVFIYDFPGSDRAEGFKSAYNNPWERSFVTQDAQPVTLTTNVNKTTVTQGEKFYDTATISGLVPRGSYVTFTAYDAVSGEPDVSTNKLLDNTRMNVTNDQADHSDTTQFEVKSPEISTNKIGKVYWVAKLYNAKGKALAGHAIGLENETIEVVGPSLTTKTSAQQTYVGRPFHDTAVINNKIDAGAYLTFTAYDAVSGKPDTNAAKLLDNKRVDIPADKIASSGAGKSFTVDSPNVTATKAGIVYWKATLYNKGGMELATHELGATGESVLIKNPSITTKVSKEQVSINEEFTDTATINGEVESGDYVTFDAYAPVSDAPNAQGAKLLDSERVNIPAKDVTASQNGQAINVTSPKTHATEGGNVYWKATLHRANGTVLATHDLGVAGETVQVKYPTITTHVSSTSVGVGEDFYDTADIKGVVHAGDFVVFRAYDAVGEKPDTNASLLLKDQKVNITAAQAKDSAQDKTVTVKSKTVNTMNGGNVYWKATLYDKQGRQLATHDLGLPEETVTVRPPTITTQVTKGKVKPSEEFADKATISGKVLKGSYVTFTAYDAVSGDPDANAPKLLDNVRVNIKDSDAEASASKKFTVTSPTTHTDNSGSVYWVATLWSPQGKQLASHDLGLPSETVQVNPGGIVTSNAQKMGATGEQLYDEITVYDETSEAESADGQVHEGEGNSNPTGVIGRIPQGSTVTVEMYRQAEEDDGDQGLFKIAEKTVTIDTNKFTAIKAGQEGNRPGKLTFKVTDPSFKTTKAGMIYWKATLKTPQGGVLDQHIYGEKGSDHKTGYKSYERTPVQKFSTTVSKKWLSDANGNYEDKTTQIYDVLHQTSYEQFDGESIDGDTYTTGKTAQTPNGAKVQFEIWAKDGANAGKMVKQYNAEDLPKVRELAKSEDPDKNHPYVGTDGLDNYQNVKSSTFPIPSDWSANKYYYRVKITVPSTTPGTGNDPADNNRDVVWYGDDDESEEFDVIHMDTKSTEPLWLDSMNVSDEITLKGNIPAGSQYEAELWRTSKDGNVRKDAATKQDDSDHNGIASEKVATTGRVNIPSKAIGAHLNGVTFRSKSVKNPGVGSYIWRVKIYTPEMPHKDGNGVGTGGDTSMNSAFGVITKEWMTAAKATTDADDSQAGDYWQNATAKQKGNGDGYADRWLLFDGKNIASEKFEVVKLTTNVTGTPNIHTSESEHYVDVTNGNDVNDKLTITGYMLKDYKVAFKLYKQAENQTADKDTVVKTLDPVALTEAQKTLDSASVHLTDPADYYWQWVFTKPDGTAFQPDNINPAVSDKRIKDESFHAVRVTTSTYKWASKNGTVQDVARLEGHLPENATLTFEMHDYATGKKVASTKSATLKELGFNKSSIDQQLTSPSLKVPDAIDYYWVEVLNLPKDDQSTPLHTGKDKVKNESFRSIEAQTDIATERYVGTVVKDHADLTNVKWRQSGDIRDDLTTGLDARWFLYKQGDGDVKTDKKIFTGDYKHLTSGQTEAYGPEQKMDEVGDYYWVIEISDPSTNHKVVKLGTQRDPRESFRIVEASSEAQVAQQVNKPTKDTVTITGHPAEGTLVSWNLYKTNTADDDDYLIDKTEQQQGEGEGSDDTDSDAEPQSDNGEASDSMLVASYQTPADGAHLITAEEAAEALKNGKVTVESPEYTPTKVGEYYWVFSLTSPTKNLAGDGQPNKPQNDKDTSHLESEDFFTDRAHVADETVQIIDATTKTKPLGHVGEKFHDTVLLQGRVPEGSQADATLYRQVDGDDSSKDEEVLTTKRTTLSEGQTFADLEDVTVDKVGVYYWREHVYVPTKHTTSDDHDKKVEVEKTPTITGKPRVSNETVSVVNVTTTTHRLEESGTKLQDKAKIEGNVVDGSYIIFTLWKQSDGDDSSKDEKVFTSDKVMLKAGQKEANSPTYEVKETGTYYWRESIYNPVEDTDIPPCVPPTGNTDEDHPCDTPVHTEKPRTPGETTDVVKVTTKAQANGTATKPVKDTALIEGKIPNDDYELVFELWKQNGNDVKDDKKVATTDAVNVPQNATTVDSPEVTPSDAGTYYWREKLVEKSTKRLVHYGDARVPGETVIVGELAKTGIASGFIIPLIGMLAVLGLGLAVVSEGKRRIASLSNGAHLSGSTK